MHSRIEAANTVRGVVVVVMMLVLVVVSTVDGARSDLFTTNYPSHAYGVLRSTNTEIHELLKRRARGLVPQSTF